MSTYFGLNDFRNTWTMKFRFVSEHGKFNVDSKNAKKTPENIDGFQIN